MSGTKTKVASERPAAWHRSIHSEHGRSSRLEVEADHTATAVAARLQTSQRPPLHLPHSPHRADAPTEVRKVVESPGQPLEGGTRAYFEPRFGVDFGQVRVHTDGSASRSARAIGARAYTAGTHIAFRKGAYAPATAAGRLLLAHELTHVLQQSAGCSTAPGLQRQADDGDAAPADDEEALALADDVDDDPNDTERESPPDDEAPQVEDVLDIEPPQELSEGGKLPSEGKWILVKLPGTLYRFEGKKRISAWGIAAGRPSHPTPTGPFNITDRDENHRSSKYGTCGSRKVSRGAGACKKGEKYVGADMHYYQNFAPAVGFHRGSPRVLSHGCIHVSDDNAETLWKWASIGTPVIVCAGSACDKYLGAGKKSKKQK